MNTNTVTALSSVGTTVVILTYLEVRLSKIEARIDKLDEKFSSHIDKLTELYIRHLESHAK